VNPSDVYALNLGAERLFSWNDDQTIDTSRSQGIVSPQVIDYNA